MKRVVVLDNIRSSYNVGSIFRTADAAGVSKIYLCGYTPAPIDRFGRKRKDIAKVALGAEDSVVWQKCSTVADTVVALKKEGFRIVAVEQSPRSVGFKSHKVASKVAYVFGNEVTGLSDETLKAADEIIEIPMKGEKESLNVSVTVGVVLFSAS